MGVSNTFGSNVFDILVGLALPWFVKALISGEAIHINSNGLMYDAVLLLGIVAVTVRERDERGFASIISSSRSSAFMGENGI